MDSVAKWVLNDEFWLPKGMYFEDLLEEESTKRVAKPSDLQMVPLYGVALLLCRWVFERLVANPLSKSIGVPSTQRKQPTNDPRLEEHYQTNKTVTDIEAKELAAALNVSSKSIQRWFRRRRNLDRPNLRKKFAEASWRCVFYLFAFTYGFSMLVKAPWLWDTSKCWDGYPRQGVWDTVYYYYMLEGGFYVSLLYSIVGDVKRKDFWEQLIHHAATILLILFSYIANFLRVGTLVMAVHDVSDILLEAAKCFSYAKKEKCADVTFITFAVVFIVSRLLLYPYLVLYTTLVKALDFFGPFPSYYFFNALLLILQGLHIFWASIIVRMALRMWVVGKVEKDARSDVEEVSSSDEDLEEIKEDKKKI